MSKTPRTEAAKGFFDLDSAVSAEFASELEMELNDAHKAFVVATDQLVQAQSELRQVREDFRQAEENRAVNGRLYEQVLRERDEAREENARLRETAILCRNVLNDFHQLPIAKKYRDTPCLSRDYASAVSISLNKLNQLLTP